MDINVLETFISEYTKQDSDEIVFIWQGGEPLLLGVDFLKKRLICRINILMEKY